MKINPGDVILYSSNGAWWDKFIHLASSTTHVSFAISDSQVVEANSKGVVLVDFDPAWVCQICRIDGMNERWAKMGRDFAVKHIGDKYSVWTAIKAGILRILGLTEVADEIDMNWDCSEFVGAILRNGIGLPICPRIGLVSLVPDHLIDGIDEFNKSGGIEKWASLI